MGNQWVGALVLVALLVGLWLLGDFDGTLPSYRDLIQRGPDILSEPGDEEAVAEYMAVDLPLPGIEKPNEAAPDVWDVLALDVRRSIFEREWNARSWVNAYVEEHYPIDEASLLRGDTEAWQESVDTSFEMFERVYHVEFEAPTCEEFGVPSWMLHQIVIEGLEKGWHCELPGASCP